MKPITLLSALAWALATATGAAHADGLTSSQLGLVVNDDEPNSVAIAELYRVAHEIPAKNIAHVRIPNKPHRLTPAAFEELKKDIDRQLPAEVRATLMVWTAPYAVECNAITAAYTNGYDAAQCLKPCGPGKESPYFDKAASGHPLPGNGGRLSMLLPTESVEQARALIERGATRFMTLPRASAYFLTTSDPARNSRAQFFPPTSKLTPKNLTIRSMKMDALDGIDDIIIYQTGMARVAKLDTLRFLPGALADHLTSTGGDLLGDSQMSSLRWLDAGATASYGTVTEPCNYWQKFPQPTVLLRHYLQGNTAIEAYWKSVAWPAQGVFIGEPLAAPYRR